MLLAYSISYIPCFLKVLSCMTVPNIPARIGPINGETSIEATRTTELFSNRPKKAIIPINTWAKLCHRKLENLLE